MPLNKKGFNSDENILADRLTDRINQMNTAMICQVKSVNIKDKTVSVLPMVQMSDLNNNPVDHSVVNDIPYIRLQGGSYGIICDPVVGDTGLVVFCSRDISNVIKNKKVTTRGSKRTYSISDGIYVASLLLEEPKTFIKFEKDKISIEAKNINISNEVTEIHSLATISVVSQEVTVTAPAINIISETVAVTGTITVKGDILADGVSLKNHIHSNGHNGGNTGKPMD